MYSNFTDLPSDYEPIQGEIVPLADPDFIAADRMSQRITPDHPFDRRQWSIYLHYLALRAFHHWFEQRTTGVTINEAQAVILTPASPDGQAALSQLQMGTFRLCLVVTDGSSEDWQIPCAAVQTPNLAAHLYLAIVVHEESGQAEILGFLRHDQIPTTAIAQDHYQLAIADLNPNLDTMLLYLSCLEPSAIPLPITPTVTRSANLRQLLIQPAISTGQWLTQQLDTLADTIAWQLLPPWEMAAATRGISANATDSPMGKLSEILMNLVRGGMTIPIDHRPAYRDLNLGPVNLRLYAIIAPQDTLPNQPPEWSLLIVLCQQDGSDLPLGIRLQIQDATTTLIDRQVDQQPGSNTFDYLYAKVIGAPTEQFIVTLSNATDRLTLPPFTFQ